MCVTPAYRRWSPPLAGQQATSSISKPFAAAHSATPSSDRSGNAAVISPSLTGSPPSSFVRPSRELHLEVDVDVVALRDVPALGQLERRVVLVRDQPPLDEERRALPHPEQAR